jgi:hypothetical protein
MGTSSLPAALSVFAQLHYVILTRENIVKKGNYCSQLNLHFLVIESLLLLLFNKLLYNKKLSITRKCTFSWEQ